MIYITGDTHGDIERFNDKALRKLTAEDMVIVCGDFGFLWHGGDKERKMLKQLRKKNYRIIETSTGKVALPPYRLHYAPVVTFGLKRFLFFKTITYDGISL